MMQAWERGRKLVGWWEQVYPYVVGAAATLAATIVVDTLRARRESRHRFASDKMRTYVEALRICQDLRDWSSQQATPLIELASAQGRDADALAATELLGLRLDAQLQQTRRALFEEDKSNRAAMRLVAAGPVLARYDSLRETSRDAHASASAFTYHLEVCSDAMRTDLGTRSSVFVVAAGWMPHILRSDRRLSGKPPPKGRTP